MLNDMSIKEQNVRYVAYTRPKRALFLLRDLPRDGDTSALFREAPPACSESATGPVASGLSDVLEQIMVGPEDATTGASEGAAPSGSLLAEGGGSSGRAGGAHPRRGAACSDGGAPQTGSVRGRKLRRRLPDGHGPRAWPRGCEGAERREAAVGVPSNGLPPPPAGDAPGQLGKLAALPRALGEQAAAREAVCRHLKNLYEASCQQ